MFGPKGCALSIIKKSFIDGYELKPLIYGNRENYYSIHNIAASKVAFNFNFEKRKHKNEKIINIRNYFILNISKLVNCIFLCDYNHNTIMPSIVWINSKNILPNILFFALYQKNIHKAKDIQQIMCKQDININIDINTDLLHPMLKDTAISININENTTKKYLNIIIVVLTNILQQ